MCRVLDVSSSGYYARVKRPLSARAVTDAALIVEIRAAHAASKDTYGASCLQIDLANAEIRVSRKRIARLMRNAGLAGVSRRKGIVTTVRDGEFATRIWRKWRLRKATPLSAQCGAAIFASSWSEQ